MAIYSFKSKSLGKASFWSGNPCSIMEFALERVIRTTTLTSDKLGVDSAPNEVIPDHDSKKSGFPLHCINRVVCKSTGKVIYS